MRASEWSLGEHCSPRLCFRNRESEISRVESAGGVLNRAGRGALPVQFRLIPRGVLDLMPPKGHL